MITTASTIAPATALRLASYHTEHGSTYVAAPVFGRPEAAEARKLWVIAAGAAFHYPPGTVHRVTAIEDTTILEVSTPQLDDVVRLEDRYGRAEPGPRD